MPWFLKKKQPPPYLGHYNGRPVLEMLPDGRSMRLVESFGFTDFQRRRWPVPEGAQVDGASIPQALWSVLGGPFEGRYRDASVVHDYYCDVRIAPWQDVHRVFYWAMLVSGVEVPRAKLMFAAVYWAGPRWSDNAIHNSRLFRDDQQLRKFSADGDFDRGILQSVWLANRYDDLWPFIPNGDLPVGQDLRLQLKLRAVQRLLAEYDPSLDDIEDALDILDHLCLNLRGGKSIVRVLDVTDVEKEPDIRRSRIPDQLGR